MVETWKNLFRRKLRTFLTALGIAVGTLALTMMGAMSEKISLLVEGVFKYSGTRIIVQPRGAFPGQILGLPLSAAVVEDIRSIPGVDAAFATAYVLYQEGEGEAANFSIGLPPLIAGVDAHRFEYERDKYPIVLSAGRLLRPDERGTAVVGVDLAGFKKVGVGDILTARGRAFRVVGLIERTLTVRDNMAFVPLADAQELLASSLPPPLDRNPSSFASQVEVYPTDLSQADVIAQEINRRINGVRALPPGELAQQLGQSVVVFNVIIVGSAIVAVVVGGLSILNTMVMAVSERTREIGIRKAVGATNGDILMDFLREAALIGLLGGLLGLAVGSLLVVLVNNGTAGQGVVIFAITPRLTLLVLLFSALVGMGAGLLPALAAARRTPVEALRAE